MRFPKNIQIAIDSLEKIPTIGPKAAEKIVLHLVKKGSDELNALGNAIQNLNKNRYCHRCFNLTDKNLCPICADNSRDQSLICVVEDILDLMAIENKNIYKGNYHILGGTARIGQRNNIKSLKINELKNRITKEKPGEIIIATNPTSEGDITAVFVKNELRGFKNIKITRIGRGMPTGGDIEYADPESIKGSFSARGEF